jgi:hypothetical protein
MAFAKGGHSEQFSDAISRHSYKALVKSEW